MDYFDWYAAYLHKTSPVADAHFDLVTEVYERRLRGERGVLNRYYKKEFQKSGVNLIIASLFLGTDELNDCMENGIFPKGAVLKKSLEMLAAFYADLEETKGKVQLITDRESLVRLTTKRSHSRHHTVGVLLYLEGLDMLEGKPELLRCFYVLGVRGAALCWNYRKELQNVLAKGCFAEDGVGKQENGIKDLGAIMDKGVQALFLMEKLGIFVDVSHLGREAAWLLPSFTKKPFAATHANADALFAHERNLTDETIKEIARRGGVIGVNSYTKHTLHENSKKSGIDALCDQVIYLIKTAGENHVGYGLDLGWGNILADYTELQKLTASLLRRGVAAATVKKIIGGNWVRYLGEMLR